MLSGSGSRRGATPFVVLGIGNLLLGDDGVGVRAAEELMQRELPPWVDVMDAGTGGVTFLHRIEGAQKVLFIDAVSWGGRPGEIVRFRPEEVTLSSTPKSTSLHASNLLEILDLARALGVCPREVIIYGIQPQRVEHRMELSPAVLAAIPEVVDRVVDEINRFRPEQAEHPAAMEE